MMRITALILLGLLMTISARAADEYVCQWTDTPIKIDGVADEPAWQRAPVIDKFVVPWLEGLPRPRNATRAKVLWDREYLYFSADMDDPEIYATETKHNGKVWEGDAFEMFLKPAADKPGYYEFEVNPLNTRFDIYFPQRGKNDLATLENEHPFKFETAVQKRKDGSGWSVEGRVRWADMATTGGRPTIDEVWGFSLSRVDFKDADSKAELSTISSMKQPSFHRHEDFASLRFAAPAGGAAYGIEKRTPWTNSRLVGYPDPLPPYVIQKAFPKLDIFQPVYVIEEPGSGDLFVLQHLGNWAGPAKIIRFKNDPNVATAETIFELKELAYSIAFHPKYAKNRYVYVYSNGPLDAPHRFNHVARYTVDRVSGKLDPATKLMVIPEWESNGHNGGGIAFGPKDGFLYLTTGDTSNDSDVANRGQDLTQLSSALLRIDVDHPDQGMNYSVPKDNPFVNTPGVRPEIFAHGFRNPWRMGIDAKTGTVWVGQNGQDLWEPVYVVHKGENYGWPVYEGSHPFHAYRKLETRTKLTMPVLEHHHSEARSLTGGIVYYGTKFPDLDGAYIYGDFSTGRIWAAKYDGARITSHREIARTNAQIVNFYADAHGDLFVSDDSGGIFKLAPRALGDIVENPFPRLLSQTGLFTDTAAHQVDPGLIPYDVIAPLWSDGAHKERFIALPGDAKIDHATSHGWNFPEGGAAVKTFSLDLEAGNSKSRRLLETRVMLKQGKNWAGYTYIWNDAQTDAELAPPQGVDQTFTIKDAAAPDGQRQKTWHYPSRAECMVCHSRAANFVLGLSDIQMNRDVDYGVRVKGGVADNQLRTLEHLAVLNIDVPSMTREQLRRETPGGDRMADTAGQREAPNATMFPRPPQAMKHLSDPADATAPLDARARSYLYANCAHCHVEAGGGNASVDLDFATSAERTKLFDVPAQANLLGPDAKLIATGRPEKSNLLHRMSIRGTGQMPPMGSNVVDTQATKLIEEWIRRMPASTRPTN